jgi:predicted RNA binding protein YcfA (HicA-like mRNA interferase family)
MSKLQKLLIDLCAQPVPSNFRWDDMVTVLESLGYELKSNSGSRRKFFHPGMNDLIICHEPHPSPNVDKGCIKDVVKHLKDHRLI